MADEHTDYAIHGAQRILRLSDIHFPFHDERALEAALNYGHQHDPTIILLSGDILDLPNLSTHPNLNPRDLNHESQFTYSLRHTAWHDVAR